MSGTLFPSACIQTTKLLNMGHEVTFPVFLGASCKYLYTEKIQKEISTKNFKLFILTFEVLIIIAGIVTKQEDKRVVSAHIT